MNSVVEIDSEFKSLIPPLSAEEYLQLETNIQAEGCRDALVVWAVPPSEKCPHCGSGYRRAENEQIVYSQTEYSEDRWLEDSYANESIWICDQDDDECDQVEGFLVLLDGHNRYEICQKHNIGFSTTQAHVTDRQSAINWIINNQLGRRNLHPDQASYLRGKRYNGEKITQGTRNQHTEKDQNDPFQPTADRLATEFKVSPATVKRDGQYAAAVDTLASVGIDPHKIIAHETKSAVVEFAKEIAPEPEPPKAPLLPPEPPKPKDPVIAAVTEKVKAGEMSVMDAAKEIRQIKTTQRREDRLDKIAEISKGNIELKTDIRYPVLYADPPWRYEYAESESRAIENQYPTMTLEDICALPVSNLATPDAILFLWATSPKLAESMRVIESWGFNYRTCAVWDKQKIGMGYYFRQQHELLLVATKGSIPTPTPDTRPPSVFSQSRSEHSAKPAQFAEWIEVMYPDLPRIELFCRSPREGWAVWGNQSC